MGLISVTFMSDSILDQEREFESQDVSTTPCFTMLAVRAFAFVLGCSAASDDGPNAIADIGEVLGQHVERFAGEPKHGDSKQYHEGHVALACADIPVY